jgi:dihydroorotase-like cyclic amidohydrolase
LIVRYTLTLSISGHSLIICAVDNGTPDSFKVLNIAIRGVVSRNFASENIRTSSVSIVAVYHLIATYLQ